MKPLDVKKMVRGKVVVGNANFSGVVSESSEHCLVAYTHWYRHDENLNKLEADFASLIRLYESMYKTSAMMYSYDYKEYK